MTPRVPINVQINRAKETGFRCPECAMFASIVDSRPSQNGWRRRRCCPNNHRFTSYEVIAGTGVDFMAEISEANRLMAIAAEAMQALETLLSEAQIRANLVEQFEKTRYGAAARKG